MCQSDARLPKVDCEIPHRYSDAGPPKGRWIVRFHIGTVMLDPQGGVNCEIPHRYINTVILDLKGEVDCKIPHRYSDARPPRERWIVRFHIGTVMLDPQEGGGL